MGIFQRHFWTPDNLLQGIKPDVPPSPQDLADNVHEFWESLRRPWRVLALAEIRYPDQVDDDQIEQLRREVHRTERIEPDWLFIRRLERQDYPAIAFQRIADTWRSMQQQLPLSKSIRVQGDAFLAANQDLKQRLRSSGLYPEERAAFDMATSGLFSDMVLPPRNRLRLPRRPQPYTAQDGISVHHLPNEVIVVSAGNAQPLIASHFQPAMARSVIYQDVDNNIVQAHLNAGQHAIDERIRMLDVSIKLAGSMARLYTMGPVGFVLMGLECLSRGLLCWDPDAGRLSLLSAKEGSFFDDF